MRKNDNEEQRESGDNELTHVVLKRPTTHTNTQKNTVLPWLFPESGILFYLLLLILICLV